MESIYLAMEDTLRVYTNGPADWTGTDNLAELRPECVAASPAVPDRVYCGTFTDGLYRSSDAGTTWQRIGTTIDHDAIMSVAISPTDPDSIWVGTEPSALYHSMDGGDTWTKRSGLTELPSASNWSFPPRPQTHHVRWIEIDPRDPDRLYLGIEAGALVLTEDGGYTYIDRPTGSRRDHHQLATHRGAPGRVYAAAGDGYAQSTDGGRTWTHPQAGLDHRYVWSVAVDPTDPDLVYVSAATGAHRAHYPSNPESYVYSREGTEHWHVRETGLPSGEGVLRSVLHPGTDHGSMYAANNHGIYRTATAGHSWHALDLPWPDRFTTQTVRGLTLV